ncbi:MAG: hypothetical protein WAV46_02835 [Candidatus Moraniibacteriota bacterium]
MSDGKQYLLECEPRVAAAVKMAIEAGGAQGLRQLIDDETGFRVFLFRGSFKDVMSARMAGARSVCSLESED